MLIFDPSTWSILTYEVSGAQVSDEEAQSRDEQNEDQSEQYTAAYGEVELSIIEHITEPG
jgi:hypothetical protein